MNSSFKIQVDGIDSLAHVKQSSFDLTILREGLFSVNVDHLPLVEYFVHFDHPSKAQQIKLKVYKTISDHKWYDKNYSEEAEIYSPEFGIREIKAKVKEAIDEYESVHA